MATAELQEPQHALYSASSSHGWIACAGMKAMEAGLPDSRSDYADEGSAAHFVGSECLSFDHSPHEFVGRTVICYQLGERSGQCFSEAPLPEGAEETSRWEVTNDMAENLSVYVSLVKEYAKDGQLFVEQRVNFGVFIGRPGEFGTADAFLLKDTHEEIVVIDLKYGYTQVEAERNSQLMLYALGVLADKQINVSPAKLQRVRLIICQPRIGNISEWVCPINELIEFAEEAKQAIEKSEEARVFFQTPNDIFETEREWQNEYLVPTEKGCQWCKAKRGSADRPICGAFERAALSDMSLPPATAEGLTDLDDELDAAIKRVYELPFDRIAKLFSAIGKLEQLIDVVQTRMLHDMMSGHKHPEFKVVKGREGNRKWKDVEAAEKIMKASHKLTAGEMYNRELISPTSAEKLIKKTYPRVWGKLEGLITRSEGKYLVAPMSDKRESLDPYGDAMAALPDLTKEDLLAEVQQLLSAPETVEPIPEEELSLDDLL